MKKEGQEIAWNHPFRDPFVLPQRSDPYEALAEFGVTYDSSMSHVHACALTAQKRRELTPPRQRAERDLCNAEKRLVLDLLYFQPQPAAFDPGEPVLPDQESGAVGAANETDASETRTIVWRLLREAWDPPSEELPPLPPPRPLSEDD